MPNAWPIAFPLDDFTATFPEFSGYEPKVLQGAGRKAMFHITPSRLGIPMQGEARIYALFLMTAHIIATDDPESDNGTGGIGGSTQGFSGIPFKATVGSVTVENTKPNTFVQSDWSYWLSGTKYGRELLSYLDECGQGIWLGTPEETARDLI